jgi:hypothetical protein
MDPIPFRFSSLHLPARRRPVSVRAAVRRDDRGYAQALAVTSAAGSSGSGRAPIRVQSSTRAEEALAR